MPKISYDALCVAAEAYHWASGGHPVPQIGTLIYQTAGVHFLDEVSPSLYAVLIAQFRHSTRKRSNRKKPRALWSSERGKTSLVTHVYSNQDGGATRRD